MKKDWKVEHNGSGRWVMTVCKTQRAAEQAGCGIHR